MAEHTVLTGDIGLKATEDRKIITIETMPGIVYEIPLTLEGARGLAKALDPGADILKGVPGLNGMPIRV